MDMMQFMNWNRKRQLLIIKVSKQLITLALPKSFDWIAYKLVILNLSDKQFTVIPIKLQKFNNLQFLDLSHKILIDDSKYQVFSFEGGPLSNLNMANLSHNKLSQFLNDLSLLLELSQLVFSHNRLSSLPPTFAICSSIRQMCLSNNQRSSLPIWLSNLSLCSTLNLSKNPVADFARYSTTFGHNLQEDEIHQLFQCGQNGKLIIASVQEGSVFVWCPILAVKKQSLKKKFTLV